MADIVAQLKKDKDSSSAELKKLQADIDAAVKKIKVHMSSIWYFMLLFVNVKENVIL